MKKYLPTKKNVKLIGRVTELENDALWMCYSATGAAFEFEGKELEIVFHGDDRCENPDMINDLCRMKIYVNGNCVADRMVDQKEMSLTVVSEEEAGIYQIEVLKVSETAMSTVALQEIKTDDEGIIRPDENRGMMIEFAGDSITCGYGVDDEVPEHSFKTSTEDATKAYAYLTAKALGVDHSLVSISGYGIISGYSCDGIRRGEQLLPKYYEKIGFSYGTMNGLLPQNVKWNFDRKADVVVINLGTNDQSFTLGKEELCEEYCSAYQAFIKTVRKNNPDAYIVSMLGVMGEALCSMAEKAVMLYQKETGDQRISFHHFTEQLKEDGLAADWHPSALTHRKTAEKLTGIIRNIMK